MVAAAVVGSAVVGAVASNAASSKAASVQQNAIDAQSGIANRQQQMAEDQWNRYLKTYGPLEDQFAQQAKDYGSEANRSQAAAEAADTVAGSYDSALHQLNSTPGLDPSSQTYLNAVSKLGISEAAQSAAAQTGARRNVDAQGIAREQDAISIGKGLPASASSSLYGAGLTASGMGRDAAAYGAQAAQSAAGIGRMFGDMASNPAVVNGVKGWFSGGVDEPTDADFDAGFGDM
jgi:hypothetical protein